MCCWFSCWWGIVSGGSLGLAGRAKCRQSWQSSAAFLAERTEPIFSNPGGACLACSQVSEKGTQKKVLGPHIIHAATFLWSVIPWCPLFLTSAYHWFQGELHVSKLFSHPNILPYQATFIADNELWVVTSFMAYGEWERAAGTEGF